MQARAVTSMAKLTDAPPTALRRQRSRDKTYEQTSSCGPKQIGPSSPRPTEDCRTPSCTPAIYCLFAVVKSNVRCPDGTADVHHRQVKDDHEFYAIPIKKKNASAGAPWIRLRRHPQLRLSAASATKWLARPDTERMLRSAGNRGVIGGTDDGRESAASVPWDRSWPRENTDRIQEVLISED